MPDSRRLNVAVVGLGFGAEFVPIYMDHPHVASVAICDKAVSYTHLRAHETVLDLVCRLLLEKKNIHILNTPASLHLLPAHIIFFPLTLLLI